MLVAGLFNGGRSEGASGWVVQWREVMLPDKSIETLAILPLHHGNHVSWWVHMP